MGLFIDIPSTFGFPISCFVGRNSTGTGSKNYR